MKLKRFLSFVKSINELDTSGSYLDLSSDDSNNRKSKYGNVFIDAPTTKGIDWGLDFKGSGGSYLVKFPVDFIDNFIPEGVDKKTWKEENSELVDAIEYSNIRISHESSLSFKRTHFPGGIPTILLGTGLGYVIYEEFIKKLGFASSRSDASFSAQKVWSKIAQDPDFVGCLIDDAILVSRTDYEEKEKIFTEWIESCLGEKSSNLIVTKSAIGLQNSDKKDDLKQLIKEIEKNSCDFRIDDELLKYDKIKKLLFEKIPKKELQSRIDAFQKLIVKGINLDQLKDIVDSEKNDLEKTISILKMFNLYYDKVDDEILKNEEIVQSIIGKAKERLVKRQKEISNMKVRDMIGEISGCYRKAFQSIEHMKDSRAKSHKLIDTEFKDKIQSSDLSITLMPFGGDDLTRGVKETGKFYFRFEINQIFDLLFDKKEIPIKEFFDKLTKLLDYISIEFEAQKLLDKRNTSIAEIKEFRDNNLSKLESLDILVSRNYSWAQNLIRSENIRAVVKTPKEHLDLYVAIKQSKVKASVKNLYKDLSKQLKKAFDTGGFDAAKDFWQKEVEGKLDSLDAKVFDDPDYGQKEGKKRNDVELEAKEHLKKRMEMYQEIDKKIKQKEEWYKSISQFNKDWQSSNESRIKKFSIFTQLK
jgi:hypothetical protein